MKKILLLILAGIILKIFLFSSNDVTTDYIDEGSYFVIEGKKPEDVNIKIYVDYFGRGNQCSGWSWNEATGKKSSGFYSSTFTLTNNYSNKENYFKFKLPFKNREPEKDCITHLSEISLIASNEVDTNGFANLNLKNAKELGKNVTAHFTDLIEAKNCELVKFPRALIPINNVLGCDFHVNSNARDETRGGELDLYYDYSEINSNTVLTYNIYKGEGYKSEIDKK
ncbi:hypothetical protein OAP63_08460 [Vibrio sp.]|nr:hypothetical protein [Vibrio sp.]